MLLIVTLAALLIAALPIAFFNLPASLLLVGYLPGAWAVRLLPEARRLGGRHALALALSNVLAVLVLRVVWEFSNTQHAVWLGLAVLHVGLIVLVRMRERGRLGAGANESATISQGAAPPLGGRDRWLLAGMVGFVVVCTLTAHVLPRGFFRAVPQPIHDYIKHHAVLWSLEQGPLPLESIFYSEPDTGPLYYYEFQHYPAAALRALAGHELSIPVAFAVMAALAAAVVILLTFHLARDVLASNAAGLIAAACAGLVGGWDAVLVALRVLGGAAVPIVLDSWMPLAWRLHNLATQYLWCPQHVMALGLLLVTVRLLLVAPWARWWLVWAPLIGAAIFGSSVYLALIFFPAAAVFVIDGLVRTRRAGGPLGRRIGGLAAVVVLGFVLMLPQALGYAAMAGRLEGGLTVSWPRFDYALLGRLVPAGPLANYLDLPWILLLELGLPGLALVLMRRSTWRDWWGKAGMRLLMIAAVLGILLFATVRSDVNTYDYSFRLGVMPAQILGALAAGALVVPALTWLRARVAVIVLAAGLLLGAPVGLYELPLMATRTLILPNPLAEERRALLFLRRQTPRDAVLFAAPDAREHLTELTDRQVAILDPTYPHVRIFWPVNEQPWFARYETALALWRTPRSAAETHAALREMGVSYVVVGEAERAHCDACPQFDDPALFRVVYRSDAITIIALR